MIKNFFSDLKENRETFFLAFVLAGYVFACAIPSLLGLDNSRYISVPFRIVVFLASVYLMFKNRCRLKLKQIFPWLLFFGFYLAKVLFSFHNDIYDQDFTEKFNEIYVRILGIVFIPCLAIFSLNYSKIDFKKLIGCLFCILFLSLLCNLIYTVFFLNQYNKINGVFSVYYITSGHFGVSLLVLALYIYIFNLRTELCISNLLLFFSVLLGFFAVFISAARSPLLALVVIVFYLAIVKREMKYIVSFLLLAISGLVFIYVAKNFLQIESAFVERNYVGIFEGNTSGREPYLERALTVFSENVIVGGRVLYENGMYPHNLFLEVLMAGGIVLFSFFIWLFMPFIRSFKMYSSFYDANKYILPLFFFWLQYFILAQTSYNIYSNPEFWYFSAVIICISLNLYNEKIKSNDSRGNTTRDY